MPQISKLPKQHRKEQPKRKRESRKKYSRIATFLVEERRKAREEREAELKKIEEEDRKRREEREERRKKREAEIAAETAAELVRCSARCCDLRVAQRCNDAVVCSKRYLRSGST